MFFLAMLMRFDKSKSLTKDWTDMKYYPCKGQFFFKLLQITNSQELKMGLKITGERDMIG